MKVRSVAAGDVGRAEGSIAASDVDRVTQSVAAGG